MYPRVLLFGAILVAGTVAASMLRADAFGVPKSNLLIDGQVRLASGFAARFQAREGTMLTVRDAEAGVWYGFSPIIDAETKRANFAAYSIAPLPKGGESVTEVDPGTDIQQGAWHQFTMPGGAVEIQVLGVKPGKFSRVVIVEPKSKSPRELQKLYGSAGGGLCVLSCDGVTVGANAVIMECGSCQGPGVD